MIQLKEEGSIALKRGDTLLATTKATQVTCGRWTINIAKGSLVWVSYVHGVLKVRNLYDNQRGAVRIASGGNAATILPGSELVVAADRLALGKAVASDQIARRMARYSAFADGYSIHQSEISLVSIMQKDGIISQLLKSADNQDKAVIDKLVRVAGALMTATAGHGAYFTGEQH